MRIVKAVAIFFAVFLLYHISLSSFFPVDENNYLQAPDWYVPTGFAISFLVAVFTSRKKRKNGKSNRKNADSNHEHSYLLNKVSEHIKAAKEREAYEDLSEVEKYQIEKQRSQTHPITYQAPQVSPTPLQMQNPVISAKRSPYDTQSVIDYYHSIDYKQILADEQQRIKEQMGLSDTEYELRQVDYMEGHKFEQWCADLLEKNGFSIIQVTKQSGDQGADVIAQKDGIRYAIQCKCYSSDLGNKPIQEVNTGKMVYHCQIGVVMTNRYFTKGAKEAAEATGVLLWDRDALIKLIEKSLKE